MPQGAAETDNFPHARHINAKNLGGEGVWYHQRGARGGTIEGNGL